MTYSSNHSPLKDLYKQVILEHSRHPRNYGELPEATHREGGHNPSCGDQLQLQLQVQGGTIRQARFTAKGCAISVASASLLTQAIQGKTVEQARELSQEFKQMIRTGQASAHLGDLSALQGVHTLATRTKCAALAWQTLDIMLDETAGEEKETVENEG